MEEGNQPGDLTISGGHGNAQEEYAMRRRRRSINMRFIAALWKAVIIIYICFTHAENDCK